MPLHPDNQDLIDAQFRQLNDPILTDRNWGLTGDFSEFKKEPTMQKITPDDVTDAMIVDYRKQLFDRGWNPPPRHMCKIEIAFGHNAYIAEREQEIEHSEK